MKTIEQLINNLGGQLNGVNKMIGDKKSCFAVLMQMKAVKSGLTSVMNKYLADNVGTCLEKGATSRERQKLKKIIAEIIKNN